MFFLFVQEPLCFVTEGNILGACGLEAYIAAARRTGVESTSSLRSHPRWLRGHLLEVSTEKEPGHQMSITAAIRTAPQSCSRSV